MTACFSFFFGSISIFLFLVIKGLSIKQFLSAVLLNLITYFFPFSDEVFGKFKHVASSQPKTWNLEKFFSRSRNAFITAK